MKLKYASLAFLGIIALTIISCKKDLVEVNQDPNGAQIAQPDFLLTAATKTTADTYWGTTNNMNSSLLFVQQRFPGALDSWLCQEHRQPEPDQ
jgi:hypothetical protein